MLTADTRPRPSRTRMSSSALRGARLCPSCNATQELLLGLSWNLIIYSFILLLRCYFLRIVFELGLCHSDSVDVLGGTWKKCLVMTVSSQIVK